MLFMCLFFVFFKQKTAYEMRISDWSSDVCSSDLTIPLHRDVKAVGNIEDWLSELELGMQRSMKALCEVAAYNCIAQPLRQLVDQSCAQLEIGRASCRERVCQYV